MDEPYVVNKFETAKDACEAACQWSKDRKETWSVIHGFGEEGLAYFVERGDGGIVGVSESLVGTRTNGQKDH